MYRKLMWCYVLILTLLDLSLNSKLTAQGKSHGITVHESLVEGITFQEWGSEAGADATSGRALPEGALRAWPPALALGRAELAAARAATVTLTNTGNATLHLASVAGTTPDFHASFFDSKTLACGANTTFSVVYLGRREGPAAAHLYIHTSLGVLKYPVSATGVASEWGLWPLTDVRVPHNATLRPLLTMHNPTAHTVQVQEIYSSASWLGLQLPGGEATAPRALWSVPPHSARALVRLRLAPRAAAATAYIRIKANVSGPALVVPVEARAAPAGDYAAPLQLRAGARGAGDPPYTFEISAGNSAEWARALAGAGGAASCRAAPHAPPPPAPDARANGAARAAQGGAEGVQLELLRPRLEPLQAPAPAARLTLDFAALWAGGAEAGGEPAGGEAGAEAGGERWCAGWAALGGSTLPYSVKLLPGTLRLPPDLHFVTADEAEGARSREVRVRNEFPRAARLVAVECAPELLPHFECVTYPGATLAPGAAALAARLTRRARAAGPLAAALRLRVDLSHTLYRLPVYLYSGQLALEWEWPNATATELPLGALGAGSTRRVRARLRNPAPAPLCLAPGGSLPGATLALQPDACLPPHGEATAVLTVVAPARAGELAGAVWLRSAHARLAAHVTLRALPGHVRLALRPDPDDAGSAPYASAPPWELVAESSMALRMRVLRVEPAQPDPALIYIPPEGGEAWLAPGASALGRVRYRAELACGARCYTGAGAGVRGPLGARLALLAARRERFLREPRRDVALLVDTDQMVRIPATAAVAWRWPRLAARGGWAGLAAAGARATFWLRVRNPSRDHALALRAQLAAPRALPDGVLIEAPQCDSGECVYAAGVFSLEEWRAPEGGVALLPPEQGEAGEQGEQGEGEEGEFLPTLVLAPRALLELRVGFLPPASGLYHAHLYLRNNLTVLEPLQLAGRGAQPRFELAGRRAGAARALLLQVAECDAGAECGAEHERGRWAARRTVLARNTGAVPLRLRAWRLAGEPCRARGFRLQPCAPLALAPNESRALTLDFHSDCGLARVAATLSLRADSGPAAFRLLAAVPARLLPACAAALPRPPWEPALRAAGALLALAALALVLAAAALDAERLLRRARDRRALVPPRAPLDLRALAREPAAPPAAPARRRRPPRRAPPPDPQAERRAFERWRAEVLRRDVRADDESSRSSEDADAAPRPDSDTEPEPEHELEPEPEHEPEPEPELEEPPRSDDGSSGSDGSAPPDDEPPAPAEPAPPPRAPGAAPPEESRPGGAPRARREPSPPPRRAEPPARPRAAPCKPHARKDKPSKRRGERPAPAARPSPPQHEPRAPPAASPALRQGASWSSVVAARALAPIGSDVRRAPPPRPAADHSLFYFNDAAHSLRAPAPPDELPWRDEREPAAAGYYRAAEPPAPGAYGAVGAAGAAGSPWAREAAWWSAPLRPPPGFAPRAPPPPPVRAFDPFHSLASIWAPGAFDWRAEPRERAPPE